MDYSRFFTTTENISNGKFLLENLQDIKKIRKVLRLGLQDKIILLDNTNKEYLCEIEEITKQSISGTILEERSLVGSSTSKIAITLAQGLPKAAKMDDVIRMNTELGIKQFIPFESKYSVVRLSNFNSKKLARWEKIAKSASEQSERNEIPPILAPINFQDLVNLEYDVKILLHSRKLDDSRNIVEIKGDLTDSSNVILAVGPEGGFSDEEVSQAKQAGWEIVWMDLPILRTQTAGVVACGFFLL